MILKTNIFEFDIMINKNRVNTLIIENTYMYVNFLKNLSSNFENADEYFIIVDDNLENIRTDETCVFIDSLNNLDLNNTKSLNSLYKILKKQYECDFYDKLKNVENSFNAIAKSILLDFDVCLKSNTEMKFEDFCKIANIKFNDETDCLIERFLNYVHAMRILFNKNIFIVCNLHAFFGKNEIEDLLKDLSYMNVTLINIEFAKYFEFLSYESVSVLDKDLCSIL